ncbi:hypothetical protein DM860_008420 [Cuscuta australis]|uniref:AP2/ERF domain-containing protein n=1 Tax=Cuscuta australis TaxID=267555 RepID=A0A328D4I8_9ASTE|nr:hypothetical protein DM860_008420 [Cuscuta australis]
MGSLGNDGSLNNNNDNYFSNPCVSSSLAPTCNYPNLFWYGVEGENNGGGLFYDLSDGSLCTTESFLRSHPQAFVTPSPERRDLYEGPDARSLQDLISHIQENNAMQHQQQVHLAQDGYPTIRGQELLLNQAGYEYLQSLSLSMSPAASHVSVPQQQTSDEDILAMAPKKRCYGMADNYQTQIRKSFDSFGQRTSQYRGVTRHRWTGRYEAHLWDNSCKKEGQRRKGRQVYLGGYDNEEKAARSYDLAAIKYWGTSTHINFPLENYEQELEEMKNMSRQECVAHLRRKSTGFSRGASIYRGVTRHHQHGRWQARIGRVAGNKDLYLGTFSSQEEAAEAYDVAAIKFRGLTAVTNFEVSRYDVDRIMDSATLLTGDQARRRDLTTTTAPCQLKPGGHGGLAAGFDYYTTMLADASSSLVNSVQSSREGSPDLNATPPANFRSPASEFYEIPAAMAGCSGGNNNANYWAAAQMRSHVPVFAAWTDLIMRPSLACREQL